MKNNKHIRRMAAAMLLMAMVLLYCPTALAADGVAIDESNFPDAVLRDYLSQKYDKNGDGSLSAYEISSATGIWLNDSKVTSLEGVEHLSALKAVYVDNTAVTELDLSKNPALEVVSGRNSAIARLNVNGCTKLHTIDCTKARLTGLDVSTNTALKYLYVNGNPLTSLDVGNCTKLQKLLCAETNIEVLDVSKLTNLEYLHCYRCKLTELDLSSCVKLEVVDCAQNVITVLKLGEHTALTNLTFKTNALTSLDCQRYKSVSLNSGAQFVDVTAYQDGDEIYIDMSTYGLDAGRIYDVNFNKNSGTYDAASARFVLDELPSVDDWVTYSYKYSTAADCSDGIRVQLNVTQIEEVKETVVPEPIPEPEPEPEPEPKPEPKPSEPEVTEPEATAPEVSEPEITEPEVTEPDATEPEVTEPEMTEPEVTEPKVTEPGATVPEETAPEDTTQDSERPADGNGWIWLALVIMTVCAVFFVILLLRWKRDK